MVMEFNATSNNFSVDESGVEHQNHILTPHRIGGGGGGYKQMYKLCVPFLLHYFGNLIIHLKKSISLVK